MDTVDGLFAALGDYVGSTFPEGPLNDLLVNGIIAGIGGIVIFLPQIIILFLFISLMEETGYMSRVVFLMDRWLKPFGLNGKSVIPLMSGAACAIPAVMSARNIENPKERLLTMLVTPFMTCSARLPIYIVIIGLVIPDKEIWGFNLQGITLFGMYLLGIIGALFSALVLNRIIKSVRQSFLIFELPIYKKPDLKNVLTTVWEKSLGFLWGAGKIILAISIILWVLGNFGPNDRFSNPEKYIVAEQPDLSEEQLQNEITAYKTEYSYLGYLGRGIEPAIKPLGYDWKIGIGLLSSFAAREVFVGTVAVVYSLGEDLDIEDEEQKVNPFRPHESRNQPQYGITYVQFCYRNIVIIILCFCNAVYGYYWCCASRNGILEMDNHASSIYDRLSLYSSPHSISTFKITNYVTNSTIYHHCNYLYPRGDIGNKEIYPFQVKTSRRL